MSIILSLIVFSVLVLIHEFGHFLLAKKNGIGVTEFSLGMGPRILSFVKGETRYSWKVIPFGGSCMMVGEDTDEISVNSFNSKSVWARISVVAAGPIFNFVLAFVLAIVYIGMQGYDEPRITAVGENVPAVEAGLKEGDIITEFNGKKIVIWRDYWLHNYLNPLDGSKVTIKYERDGKEYETKITPRQSYSMGISYYADEKEVFYSRLELQALPLFFSFHHKRSLKDHLSPSLAQNPSSSYAEADKLSYFPPGN